MSDMSEVLTRLDRIIEALERLEEKKKDRPSGLNLETSPPGLRHDPVKEVLHEI